MASFVDDMIIQSKDYEDLDEEKAARSIVLSNITPEVRGEELLIHFQKNKNGGGDVDRLCMIEADGNVVITFDKADVARSVLAKEQILQKSGKKITVQAFHVARPPEVPEVFHRVSARLNSEIFPPSGYADSRKLLRRIAAETEVEWHEACDGFIVSGSFEQLQNAYQQLNRHLHRAALQNPETPRELSSRSAKVTNNIVNDSAQKRVDEDEEQEDIYKKEVVKEIPPFDVEPRFMKFLKNVHGEKLNEIVERFSVHIEWPSSGEDTKAYIKAMPECRMNDYNDAYESFISLYQKLHSNMKQEAVAHNKGEVEVETAAAIVEDKFPVVIFKTADQVLVYGSKESVHAATKMVRSKLGVEQEKGDTLRRKVRKSSGDREDGQRSREAVAPSGSQPYPPVLLQVLSNGVRLSVYQEDITNAPVDVIVNAANECLDHNGGVAKAIQDKGGRQIFDESQAIMISRAWRPLSVGDAVFTSAGKLYCSAVIHTVGPIWGKQNNDRSVLLLHTAIINSLRLAAIHRVRSIAFPAISSGSFGMPKELSARAMFDAVEEYSRSVEAQQFCMCDIRFVNIDSPTVDVFKQEFVKRFGEGTPITSSAWLPQALTVHSNTGVESYLIQGQGQAYSRMSNNSIPPPSVNQVYDQRQMGNVQNFGAQQQHVQPASLTYGRQDLSMTLNQTQGTFPSHDFTCQGYVTSTELYGQNYYSKTNVPNTSPQLNQPPSYHTVGNERSHGEDRRIKQQFGGNKETPFGVGGQNSAQASATSESSAVNPEFTRESANQPIDYTNTNFAGIALTRGTGRGRGVTTIAAKFGNTVNSPPHPGTAVKVVPEKVYSAMKETQGAKLGAPASTKVITDAAPSRPPPGFPPNYRSEMQTAVNSPVTSQSEGGENTAGKTTLKTDADEPKLSDLNFVETPEEVPAQKNTEKANDSDKKIKAPGEESASDSTPDGNTSTEAIKSDKSNSSSVSSFSLPEAQRTSQTETVKPDLKDPSTKTTSTNKESTPKSSNVGEDIPEDAKVPPRSPQLPESNEGRDDANPSDDKNYFKPDTPSLPENNKMGDEQKRNIVEQKDVMIDRDTSSAEGKDEPGESLILKLQKTELQKNDHQSSSPSQVNRDSELNNNSHTSGESDHSKDPTREVDVSSSVDSSSQNEENSSLNDEHNYNPNIHSNSAETLERQEPFKGDSSEKTTSASNGEVQKEKDVDIDDQMPPLSDVSEEDNQKAYPKQGSCDADYTADQPLGYMTWSKDTASLPGYERSGTVIIRYMFPAGVQGVEHPNPGQPYLAFDQNTYLPDTAEGREILGLLEKAFNTRQLFTLKCSNISSQPGQIVWSDIPHKTSRTGGPSLGGYPDPHYLEEVKTKLTAHGIVSPPK